MSDTSQRPMTISCRLLKAEGELRVVTGIVLVPDDVDAHNDFATAPVIRDAAYDFLCNIHIANELGVQHEKFGNIGLELVESYVAPLDFRLGGEDIKKGTWIMSVRVKSDDLWEKVKTGELTGFSIGATATVVADGDDDETA